MKKIFITCIACIILCVVMFSFLKLVKTGARENGYRLSKDEKTFIYNQTKGLDESDIIDWAAERASSKLSFSQHNKIKEGKANCVGYAQYTSAIMNYAFKINGINSKSKPVVGYVSLFSINLCKVLKSLSPTKWKNFVKDHDFVEVKNSTSTYYVDSCIYDLIGNKCLTVK